MASHSCTINRYSAKAVSYLLFLLINTKSGLAQRPTTGSWFTVQPTFSVNKKFIWHNDAGYRTLGNSVQALQYFYRTGIKYQLTKNFSATGGVAFFFSKTNFNKANHEYGHEFRLWQEANYLRQLPQQFQWQVRLRMEQRFFATTSLKSSYTTQRFLFRTGITKKVSKKWSLQLANEYMQQFVSKKFNLDQNRLIITGNYKLKHLAQLVAGYIYIIWPNDVQHIATLTFIKNFAFKKITYG